jgi:hypothetical protein
MEELQPEDLEELVQELEEEDRAEEISPQEVEALLRDLQADSIDTRRAAAERLGKLTTSNPEIVQALIAAKENDAIYAVKKAAEDALRAPVHQEYLAQHRAPTKLPISDDRLRWRGRLRLHRKSWIEKAFDSSSDPGELLLAAIFYGVAEVFKRPAPSEQTTQKGYGFAVVVGVAIGLLAAILSPVLSINLVFARWSWVFVNEPTDPFCIGMTAVYSIPMGIGGAIVGQQGGRRAKTKLVGHLSRP